MGYKSLAQMPARRNAPVTSNVRAHRKIMANIEESKDNIAAAKPLPDPMDRLKTIATIVTAILVPIAVAFVGGYYSGLTKDREIQGKFVELAVSILKEPPEKQSLALRSWAIDVLNDYSGVKIPEPARKSLMETISLPGATAAVRDVQLMLAGLGYFKGTVDGQITPQLREAVASFQRANGITADGIMGSSTVTRIIEQYTKNVVHSVPPNSSIRNAP